MNAWPGHRPYATRRVVLALARVEARLLLRHPATLVGCALAAVMTYGWIATIQLGGAYMALIGGVAVPIALGTFIAANLAASRSQRNGVLELHVSLPAPPRARPAAQLLALAAPVAATAAAALAGLLLAVANGGLLMLVGSPPALPGPVELLQGPLAVAALGALGVALARWVPFAPAAFVLAPALLLLQMPLVLWANQRDNAWLAPVVNPSRTPEGTSWPCGSDQTWPCAYDRLATGELAWHLAYVAALTALLVVLALARDGATPRLRAAGAVALAVAGVTGILQLP